MFRTEHLEGRIRYETEQVVCFDVYFPSNITEKYFVCQALLSLVNGHRAHTTPSHVLYNNYSFDDTTIFKEINEGINDYINIRKDLALTTPFLTE